MSLHGLAATSTPAYLSPDSAPRRPVCEGSPEAGRQVVRQTPQRNESQRQAWFGSWLLYCLTLEQGKTLAVPGLVTLGEAMPKENEEIEGEIMYLTEYLRMRGVNANALTHAEAELLNIDITAKGWVERNAHVVVPEELANAVRNGARKAELRALAGSLLNHTLPMDAPVPAPVKQLINPGHAHEAMDRCHVMISMLDSHLLNHPYVESDADVRVAVESAIDSLARAYQLIGKDAK